jgi:hypothetical protein
MTVEEHLITWGYPLERTVPKWRWLYKNMLFDHTAERQRYSPNIHCLHPLCKNSLGDQVLPALKWVAKAALNVLLAAKKEQ